VVGGFAVIQTEFGYSNDKKMSITGVAVAHGLILGIAVWAGAAISGGHYNWAVT